MGAECPFSLPHLFYCQGWGAGEAALGQLSGNPSEHLECSLPPILWCVMGKHIREELLK